MESSSPGQCPDNASTDHLVKRHPEVHVDVMHERVGILVLKNKDFKFTSVQV